jgi:hypothetical protein
MWGGVIMPCIANAVRPVVQEEQTEEVDPVKYRFSGYQLPMDNQRDKVEASLQYWSQPSFWSNRAVTYSNVDMR